MSAPPEGTSEIEELVEVEARRTRHPWVIGTAFDVWQIVDARRDLGSIEAMVAEGNLAERQVRLALAYAEAFPDEIAEAIAENRQSVEQLSRRYPFIETVSVDA